MIKHFRTYNIIFPLLKRLEESRVVLENRSLALQWFRKVTSTTRPAYGVAMFMHCKGFLETWLTFALRSFIPWLFSFVICVCLPAVQSKVRLGEARGIHASYSGKFLLYYTLFFYTQIDNSNDVTRAIKPPLLTQKPFERLIPHWMFEKHMTKSNLTMNCYCNMHCLIFASLHSLRIQTECQLITLDFRWA